MNDIPDKYINPDILFNIKKCVNMSGNEKIELGDKIIYVDKLIDIKNELNNVFKIIDVMEQKYPNKWHDVVARKIKIFDNIKYELKNKHKIKHVSNAWLKLFEILREYPIVKNNDKITSVHMCEAPGSWIVCFQYYLMNYTKVKTHAWYAQSLNPESKQIRDKYGKVFQDQYNLMRDFPKKWIFGETCIGDITDVENILSYKKLLPNEIDVMTFDCGLRVEYHEDKEIKLGKIFMAKIILVLSLLSNGGNFISKIYFPYVTQLNISLIYILYNSFDQLIFTKPLTSRPSNQELYMIGIGYKGFEDIEYLIEKFKNYDINKPITNVSEDFLKQFVEITKCHVDRQIGSLHRTLYYFNNFDKIKDWSHIETLKKIMTKKWINKNLELT